MFPVLPHLPLKNPGPKQVRVLADAAFKYLIAQAKIDWKTEATRPNVEQIGHDIAHLVREPEDFLESIDYITLVYEGKS